MRLPSSIYNWLSITGFIVVFNSLILMLFIHVFTLLYNNHSSYLDVYIYVILPLSLVLGVILILCGMYIRIKKDRKGNPKERNLPVIDFNEKPDQIIMAKIGTITVIFLIASFLGSYKAYLYTNSSEFCGELCHNTMKPEYTTYLNSSHAKVSCMGCHAGEGAGWFVQSRLSIVGMAYSMFTNNFPRPIPASAETLRPDRKTCENCHWPQKFYTRKLLNQVSYLADSANTEWNISLLLKLGPKNTARGLKEGIHWHINPDVRIEYSPTNESREIIPWIRYTNLKTGVVKIFTNPEQLPAAKNEDPDKILTMDCMDCHNRPSHLFLSAPDFIDHALSAGILSPQLPYIKKAAMEALKQAFETTASAREYIPKSICNFYSIGHKEIWKSRKDLIEASARKIVQEYEKNNFPEMKVDASCYPSHLGHMESNGCFRCHSGKHITKSGELIPSNCNLCHSIIEQGSSANFNFTNLKDTLEFVHPVPLKKGAANKACSDCHKALYN